MNAELTAMAVAIVGVLGTLLAPVLAQWSTARANRVNAERDREVRREERVAAERRTVFEERRTEYTILNALGRSCRNALKTCGRKYQENGSLPDEDLAAAHEARLAYQERYDSAQMVLPDDVLVLASGLNRIFAEGYRNLRGMASTGVPTAAAFAEFCDGPMLDQVTKLRHAMREDLGVGQIFVDSTQHVRYDISPSDGAEAA